MSWYFDKRKILGDKFLLFSAGTFNADFLMFNRIILVVCLAVTVSLPACKDTGSPKANSGEELQRTFTFSGFEWIAEGSGPERRSPGSNYYSCSEKNVWVDSHGDLHLRITKRKGIWYCSKVTMKNSYGYGRYSFLINSRVDKLDKNVVGGLFTYLDDLNEIDIEFARWGTRDNNNGQFAVQPAYRDGNIYRFSLDLKNKKSTHIIDWKSDTINFSSYRGHHSSRPSERNIISEWNYTGEHTPPEGEEKVMINLWLFNGTPPANNSEAEMVIKAVEIY